MQIGFVKQESKVFRDRENKEVTRTWFEIHFRVGGVRPFTAKMVRNKNKGENSSEPDYHIYMRANVNKGDKFRDFRVGALWLKSKEFDGVTKTFMTGNVFMDLREVPIAVWKAEPRFDGEVVNYLYDVSMMREKPQDNDDDTGYETVHEDAAGNETPPMTDENGEEIPF